MPVLPIFKKDESTLTSRTTDYYFNHFYSNSVLEVLSSDQGDPQTGLWETLAHKPYFRFSLYLLKMEAGYPPATNMSCQAFRHQDKGHGRSQGEKPSSDILPHSLTTLWPRAHMWEAGLGLPVWQQSPTQLTDPQSNWTLTLALPSPFSNQKC